MNKSINMKRILYIILPLILIALVVIKLKNNKEITQNKVYVYDKEQAIHIQVDTVQLEYENSESSFAGTFEPNKETKVSAETPGKINTMMVDVGSIVVRGQPLLMLDNSLLSLQLQSAEVQIEGLESDVKRFTILANADAIQGIQLEKSALALKTAKVQRATLLEQINKTTIRAPFDGVVTAKLSEEGAFAAPGVPLLQITDIKNLKFTINIPENDLKQFELNQIYTITSDTYSEIKLNGKAIMLGSKANLGSSFPVQFSANNTSDLKIKSGMFGKVNLNNNTQEMGLIIQNSAIVGNANQPQVYIVKEGKVTLQNITVSKKLQNRAVISSGLEKGDVIVKNGFINLFEGANVTYN